MLQPITECGREERMERALMALEAMSTRFGEVPDDFRTVTPEEMCRFVAAVYRISHTAPGRCGNPHPDWLAEVEEIEAESKKSRLYDPEESMGRAKARAETGPPA